MKRIVNTDGSYSIIYYYNDKNERVEEEQASHGYIAEFDANGNLVNETTFVQKQEEKFNEFKENSSGIDLLEDTKELPKINL